MSSKKIFLNKNQNNRGTKTTTPQKHHAKTRSVFHSYRTRFWHQTCWRGNPAVVSLAKVTDALEDAIKAKPTFSFKRALYLQHMASFTHKTRPKYQAAFFSLLADSNYVTFDLMDKLTGKVNNVRFNVYRAENEIVGKKSRRKPYLSKHNTVQETYAHDSSINLLQATAVWMYSLSTTLLDVSGSCAWRNCTAFLFPQKYQAVTMTFLTSQQRRTLANETSTFVPCDNLEPIKTLPTWLAKVANQWRCWEVMQRGMKSDIWGIFHVEHSNSLFLLETVYLLHHLH